MAAGKGLWRARVQKKGNQKNKLTVRQRNTKPASAQI